MGVRAGLASAVAGALLTGCAAAPAGSTPSPMPSPSASAAGTLAGTKAADRVTLPGQVGNWKLARRADGAQGARLHFYERVSNASQVLVATVSPVPLTAEAVAQVLPARKTVGPATCGLLAGGANAACYVPLSGGNLSVVGPLGAEELGEFTEQLYAALG